MGLPRHLKNKEDAWINYINKNDAMPMELYDIVEHFFALKAIFYTNIRKDEFISLNNNVTCNCTTRIPKSKKKYWRSEDFIRHAIKFKFGLWVDSNNRDRDEYISFYVFEKFCPPKSNDNYFFDSVSVSHDKFSLEDDIEDLQNSLPEGIKNFYSYYKGVRIKSKFRDAFINISKKRYIEHYNLLMSNYKIYEYKYWKTSNYRVYTGTLRQLIFERDNYSCQCCGISKDKVIEKGIHLEVDHIIEWEDGGQTTYENGQTLCSECNKAKHRVKRLKTA